MAIFNSYVAVYLLNTYSLAILQKIEKWET